MQLWRNKVVTYLCDEGVAMEAFERNEVVRMTTW